MVAPPAPSIYSVRNSRTFLLDKKDVQIRVAQRGRKAGPRRVFRGKTGGGGGGEIRGKSFLTLAWAQPAAFPEGKSRDVGAERGARRFSLWGIVVRVRGAEERRCGEGASVVVTGAGAGRVGAPACSKRHRSWVCRLAWRRGGERASGSRGGGKKKAAAKIAAALGERISSAGAQKSSLAPTWMRQRDMPLSMLKPVGAAV